jgi:hypothetical protein
MRGAVAAESMRLDMHPIIGLEEFSREGDEFGIGGVV